MQIREDTKRSLELIKAVWQNADDQLPSGLIEIPSEEKLKNEAYADQVSYDFHKQMNSIPRLPIGRKKWCGETEAFIMNLLNQEQIIGIHTAMQPQELEAFYRELMEFSREARSFSPELSFAELGQAIRNYIVYAMFKVINRSNTGFSKAGFGYSMLYPFTDNYIDTIANSLSEKQDYNQLIRDTIEGKAVHLKDNYYRKTHLLLKAIEGDYPREREDGIYTLLLMMLEAQEESLGQQSRTKGLTPGERLDISLFKGGVSVLVDRYLINKPLTEEDYLFYLGFGFFLQLADDLQDIGEDSRKGYQTIFTQDLKQSTEERTVNKLLNFLHHIMESYSAENNQFKDFVKQSSYQLIYSSVVGSRDFFSEEYLLQIEKLLPVSIPYLEKTKSGMIERQEQTTQDQYMKLLDCLVSHQR